MIKKILTFFFVGVIIFAIWKVSGGNLGAFVMDVWHNIVFPAIDITSNWLIHLWHSIFG